MIDATSGFDGGCRGAVRSSIRVVNVSCCAAAEDEAAASSAAAMSARTSRS
jgi:hypothetical protein